MSGNDRLSQNIEKSPERPEPQAPPKDLSPLCLLLEMEE
jgi:hypothetical protein